MTQALWLVTWSSKSTDCWKNKTQNGIQNPICWSFQTLSVERVNLAFSWARFQYQNCSLISLKKEMHFSTTQLIPEYVYFFLKIIRNQYTESHGTSIKPDKAKIIMSKYQKTNKGHPITVEGPRHASTQKHMTLACIQPHLHYRFDPIVASECQHTFSKSFVWSELFFPRGGLRQVPGPWLGHDSHETPFTVPPIIPAQ